MTPGRARRALASTAANPGGIGVLYDRDFQSATGPQETVLERPDVLRPGRSPVRQADAEPRRPHRAWEHFATTGENIYTFPWAFAPRLSAAYDVLGDGRHKASAYWGRYYDPVRNNMTNFAGTLTGSIIEEQVYVARSTSTSPTARAAARRCRTRSSRPTTQDAVHRRSAARLRRRPRPQHELRRALLQPPHPRHPRGLRPRALRGPERLPTHGSDSTHPNSLFLGYDYFGYTENPGSNFVIGTLAGGKRDFQRPRVRVPQALRQQLAVADVLQLERREGQHQLGRQRRLPG